MPIVLPRVFIFDIFDYGYIIPIYIYIVVSCARVFARSKKSGGAGRSVNERKSVWVSSILIFYKIYWIFSAVSSGVCFVSFDAPNARAHSLCAWTECPNIVYIYIELMSADNAHRSYSYVAAPVLVRQLNTFSYVYVLFRFLSCCSLPRVWFFFLFSFTSLICLATFCSLYHIVSISHSLIVLLIYSCVFRANSFYSFRFKYDVSFLAIHSSIHLSFPWVSLFIYACI